MSHVPPLLHCFGQISRKEMWLYLQELSGVIRVAVSHHTLAQAVLGTGVVDGVVIVAL